MPVQQDARDPVPSLAREILELYRGPLAEVRFPDLDRAVLETSTDALVAAQRELEDAERALADAQAKLAERSAALLARAQRGLAYAQVFAQDQPPLLERLLALRALSAAPTSSAARRPEAEHADIPAPRRRGRPRKHAPEDATSLFAADPSSPADPANPPEAFAARDAREIREAEEARGAMEAIGDAA
jgi:hypothetical protein